MRAGRQVTFEDKWNTVDNERMESQMILSSLYFNTKFRIYLVSIEVRAQLISSQFYICLLGTVLQAIQSTIAETYCPKFVIFVKTVIFQVMYEVKQILYGTKEQIFTHVKRLKES